MELPTRVTLLSLLFLLLSCFVTEFVDASGIWQPTLIFEKARRTQRDVALNQTLDQLTFSGINLNKELWDQHGYRLSTLNDILSYLNIGVNSLVMDLYWDETAATWQFCPEAFSPNITDLNVVQKLGEYQCERALNLSMVFDTVDSYLSDTNTQLNVNIVELFFNIKSLTPDYKNKRSSSFSLSTLLADSLGSAQYTPEDYRLDVQNYYVDKGAFPTLHFFLYSRFKRVLPIVLSNELLSNSTYGKLNEIDGDSLFINGYNVNVSSTFSPDIESNLETPLNVAKLSSEKFRLVTDSSSDRFTVDSVKQYVLLGYSPILSSTYKPSIVEYEYNSLWSWSKNQPDSSSPVYELFSNLSDTNKRQVANQCAVMYKTGWVVDNCYNERQVACQNDSYAYHWKITEDKMTYFNVKCPDGFSFSVPRNSLENRALQMSIKDEEISDPVWIDLNSITVVDCWVTGGPYAGCPYKDIVSRNLFVGMITPASTVLLILIAMIIALKFDTTPVQQNRRHWKKLMNEFNEKDYEGVPS